jgi:hypothetical protein
VSLSQETEPARSDMDGCRKIYMLNKQQKRDGVSRYVVYRTWYAETSTQTFRQTEQTEGRWMRMCVPLQDRHTGTWARTYVYPAPRAVLLKIF